MTSKGIPDLQTKPVLVAPGQATPAITIDTQAEGKIGLDHEVKEKDVIASQHGNTVFFRFHSKEAFADDPARQPSVLIQANHGTEVEIIHPYPSISGLNDGVNPTDAANAARFDTPDQHGCLIKVWVHIPGIVLMVKIKNNDQAAHQFTWATGGSQSETRQALSPRRQPKSTSTTAKKGKRTTSES